MIVSFSGHRPDKLGGYHSPWPHDVNGIVTRLIRDELHNCKPDIALVGMAQGVDQLAAVICYELHIPYIACVPFVGQERIWPKVAQVKYKAILDCAYKVVIVSGPEINPIKALELRNEYMVDNSDLLLAVWNGTRGGTKNCIDYAELVGKPWRHLKIPIWKS